MKTYKKRFETEVPLNKIDYDVKVRLGADINIATIENLVIFSEERAGNYIYFHIDVVLQEKGIKLSNSSVYIEQEGKKFKVKINAKDVMLLTAITFDYETILLDIYNNAKSVQELTLLQNFL